MNISANLDGLDVTIVAMSVDDNKLWITYVDPSNNLKLKKKSIRLTHTEPFQTIATNAIYN